jgi:thiol:disulfide interchange protein
MQDDADSSAGVLQTGRFWLVIGAFFAAGIALAFTPCVLLMILSSPASSPGILAA